jgi:muramidase (phage lysozyme)
MTPSPAFVAFLSLIAYSEGTSTSPITQNQGYDIIVSGVNGSNRFSDYSAHPFASGRPPIEVVAPGPRFPEGLYSTASGRYQIILPTWKELAAQLKLPDFTPASQDAACIELLRQKGAAGCILANNIQQAIENCSGIWASFPDNQYDQPGGKTMGQLLDKYEMLIA